MIVETNPKAHYHIPSDDEWIKAAYYKGDGRRAGYWMYPTQNDTAPANGTSNDVANYANYQTYHGGLRSNFLDNELKITTVDCFDRTATFYRAHDMGGNVAEWTIPGGRSGFALVRGGSWNSGYSWYGNNDLMRTVLPKSYDPSTATNFIGFRVAVTIDPKSLPVQKVQAATSDVVKDSSISDGASSEHASSWKISPREQVFFEMMMITGLVLTGTAVGFLTGEVLIDAYAEGISYEVICGILKKKLTAGRLIMIISHILFNAYCITETEG